MNPERWREIEAVLDATLDSDPSRWPAILDERCAHDPSLRREVEALLGRYQDARRFLDAPPAAAAAALVAETQARTSAEGTRVGPYRIVRLIGQGGTARVYLAERDDGHFRQRVALKLLRPEHDSEIDQGRFRAERQILATLSHPHIARLLDGGMSDDGQPYLVMELIEGEPINRYCETHALPLSERLEMFLTVCEATQYAHRNLVVHRDLKPSNILVTADGQVKLLDFGLAKLLEPGAGTRVSHTTQRWMTPEYAAPEQVRNEPVTTLTDVYQLGVVLYELITGVLPFGRRQRSPYDLAQAILMSDPPRPSTVGPRRSKAMRGDLDAIVLRAMRKEPEQRYASAQALREDIERLLAGMPVRARQGTAVYRAVTFVRRHRWSVAAAAALVVLLAGYVVTLTVSARRMAATLARVEQEKTKAQGATQFLVGLFSPRTPGLGPRDTLTAEMLLARGERHVEELRDQPLAQAQLLSVLGTIHRNMRAYDRATVQLERALALRRASLGEEHADVAESMVQLGRALRGLGDYERARQLFEGALAIQRRVLGEDDPVVAETRRISQLGAPIDDRIALAREALAAARRVHGAEDTVVAENMRRVGMLLREKGLLDEAEVVFRASLAMRQRLSPSDDAGIAAHLSQLAILLKHRGQPAEAERLHRAQLALMETRYGPDHPDVQGVLLQLADVLVRARKFDEAERLARRALAIQGRTVGEDHLDYADPLFNLANVLQAKGDLREAEALRRHELAIMRRTYGANHANVAGSLHGLGMVLLDRREYAEAETLLLESQAIRERSVGADSPGTALIVAALGRLARERRQYAAADSLLRLALSRLTAAGFTDLQEGTQQVHRELALLYEAWGKPDSALRHRRLLILT